MNSDDLEPAELLPGTLRNFAVVLLGLFVAVAIGAVAAIVAFFVGMLVFASRQDQVGGLAMIIAPLIAFVGGAWYGWRLIRRASKRRRGDG